MSLESMQSNNDFLFDDLFPGNPSGDIFSLDQQLVYDQPTQPQSCNDGANFWDSVFTDPHTAVKRDDHGQSASGYLETENFDPPFFNPQDSFWDQQFTCAENILDFQLPVPEVAGEVIPRAEVEDLFKDVVHEHPNVKNILDSSGSANPKKGAKEINWMVDSEAGFSIEQISMLRSQITQSFQLCAQSFAIERELEGKHESSFWEDQLVLK
jgi:hypothetical protein